MNSWESAFNRYNLIYKSLLFLASLAADVTLSELKAAAARDKETVPP